ncbi:MAG: DUF3347 domain-containing protein [Thermoanaerobaculales bacterium]
MNKTVTIAMGIALALALFPQPASAGKAGQFEQVFSHYNSIRLALAADSTTDVPYHTERLAQVAGSLARKALRDESPKKQELGRGLREISEIARELGRSSDLETVRAEFGKLSDALSWFRSNAGVEDTVVVFCPLHNNMWLQRSGDRISNPYLGETRGRCGEVLNFPQPRWSPERPPRLSPTDDPSGGGS